MKQGKKEGRKEGRNHKLLIIGLLCIILGSVMLYMSPGRSE